jgi:hypothetical protein
VVEDVDAVEPKLVEDAFRLVAAGCCFNGDGTEAFGRVLSETLFLRLELAEDVELHMDWGRSDTPPSPSPLDVLLDNRSSFEGEPKAGDRYRGELLVVIPR